MQQWMDPEGDSVSLHTEYRILYRHFSQQTVKPERHFEHPGSHMHGASMLQVLMLCAARSDILGRPHHLGSNKTSRMPS